MAGDLRGAATVLPLDSDDPEHARILAGHDFLRRGKLYRNQTFGSTDMPGRKTCSLVSPWSNVIFTGMRCTTFTKFPVAFSGGKRLVIAPLAPAMLCRWPL